MIIRHTLHHFLGLPNLRSNGLSSLHIRLDHFISNMAPQSYEGQAVPVTKILSINSINPPGSGDLLEWFHRTAATLPESKTLNLAAQTLRNSNCPVAFPTETVYGLGADATRSEAVKGIYRAKQRPADNPLIVHFSSIDHLEKFLQPHEDELTPGMPSIYASLVQKFWPGPLTILLPVPSHSSLAPEVTHQLRTFGARIPSSPIARLLIALTDRPVAAPSANASGKPSPTLAEHVLHDLNGRIEYILDGGPCNVGVESTVVDGLSDPPAILRPGGVGIEDIRACGGKWEKVTIGYQDKSPPHSAELNGNDEPAPRAPGMKYRHYAPKAKVVLVEAFGLNTQASARDLLFTNGVDEACLRSPKVGVVRTRDWKLGFGTEQASNVVQNPSIEVSQSDHKTLPITKLNIDGIELIDVFIGSSAEEVARGLFSALRSLDEHQVDTIIIEGIPDTDGDLAAAVMNRLRKAAEVIGS